MFSAIYFAVASTLSSGNLPEPVETKILSGRWIDAANAIARLIDDDANPRPEAAAIQLHGDLMLITGRPEDAESSYRLAQRSLRGSRDALRIASCRNTGWQALFREQPGIAFNCFRRVTQETCATPDQRLESLLGMTLVLHQLGCTQAARDTLAALTDLAGGGEDRRWAALANALNDDLSTQYALYHAEPLADHVYWRSEAIDFLPAELCKLDEQPGAACADDLARVPVLSARLRYLDQLRALATGKIATLDQAEPYVQWVRQFGLTDYRLRQCVEVALAALVASSPHVAETMLDQCDERTARHHQHARWHLDYQYCLAKVFQQQGRIREFSQRYGSYVFAAMKHARADTAIISLVAREKQTAPDDIGSRLPGKYRRAYRYMMSNLDQRDLSVREIASHIGVTERAIQAVFKNTLGLSPSQLIRRQRMERARHDLADEGAVATRVPDGHRMRNVAHVASLASGYR